MIKGADKGSAVVVWGLEDYCKEACNQLGVDLIHEKIRKDPVESLSKSVDKILMGLKDEGFITKGNC